MVNGVGSIGGIIGGTAALGVGLVGIGLIAVGVENVVRQASKIGQPIRRRTRRRRR